MTDAPERFSETAARLFGETLGPPRMFMIGEPALRVVAER